MASIANTGWHVPTNNDFVILITYLGGYDQAGKIKEIGTTYWDTPNINATNQVRFNARGAGDRAGDNGEFYDQKQWLGMWISEEGSNPVNGKYQHAQYNIGTFVTEGLNEDLKTSGLSIRLIKDSTSLTNGQEGTYTGNDGKIYSTICIGTQEWLASNLDETKYSDGTDIVVVTDDAEWAALTSAAMCYYDNEAPVIDAYILPPTGWHVPTRAEFITLITYLDGTSVDGVSNIAGGYLKKTGITNWLTPNTGADNSSGLTMLGSGLRSEVSGSFYSLLQGTILWASDTMYGYPSILGPLSFSSAYVEVGLASGPNNNSAGYSIRLIKDSTSLTNGQTSTVTDYDGNLYNTICIGTQEWMASNLRVIHYNDGTDIPNIIEDAAWVSAQAGAYCIYDNEPYVPPVIPDPYIPQYYHVTDGTAIYRKGVRAGAFVIDRALTALAFGGIEDTDWINLQYAI